MRRYLMVSPVFPPMSHVGAKRALHFARNTPKFGWEAAVVCLPRTESEDPALAPLVPDVPVLEALRRGPLAWLEDRLPGKSANRHYRLPQGDGASERAAPWQDVERRLRRFLQFPLERSALHIAPALPACLRFMRRHRCEVVYANASPYTAVVIGAALSFATGAPLVVDLRDPWSIEPYYRAAWGGWQRALVDALEGVAFSRASSIVLNTEASRDAYRACYSGRVPAERFTCIRNHYDPGLYEPFPPRAPRGRAFRIVYYGHLRPSKNGALFLEALGRMVRRLGLGPEDVRFEMFGERTAIEDRAIAEHGLSDYVHCQPWTPFFASRRVLSTADLLLDPMGPEHGLQISGKLYDYLAAGRPILSISTNPEIARILAETGLGWQEPVDAARIEERLCRAYLERERWREPDPALLVPYQAEAAARRLAALFDDAVREGVPRR